MFDRVTTSGTLLEAGQNISLPSLLAADPHTSTDAITQANPTNFVTEARLTKPAAAPPTLTSHQLLPNQTPSNTSNPTHPRPPICRSSNGYPSSSHTPNTNPTSQSPHPNRQRDRAGHRARLQGTAVSLTSYTTPNSSKQQGPNTTLQQQVQRIKERVEEKEGIPPQQQRLIYGGKQM